MSVTYDIDNVFAKILRGEIPCDNVYEDDHVLAFRDIAPHAEVHILIIPKGKYTDMSDFSANASEAEIVALTRAVAVIVKDHGLSETGYRMIANTGENGGQEVPHLHWHILGGEDLGPMLPRKEC